MLLLNQLNLAASRSFEMVAKEGQNKKQKREVAESQNALEIHSRQKRSWSTAFSVAAGAAFATSVGVTIYTEITKCNDFEPNDCKTPSCQYYDCPNVCTTPDVNDDFLQDQRDEMTELLDEMDKTKNNVLDLSLDAASAGISNERILAKIEAINDKVDRFMFEMVERDLNISKEFANRTTEISSLLRDYALSINDIVTRGEVQGIFDKWTWEGTGIFALTLALPIAVKGVQILKQRYAVNKIYNNMKADFLARVDQNIVGGTNARAVQRDYWVKSLEQPKVKAQLKASAKAAYTSQQASQKPSAWGTRISNSFNAVAAALGIYSTWYQIDQCEKLASAMQDEALRVAEERDEMEEVKATEIDPLWESVQTEAWDPVKALLTNETTTLLWLEEIRNLTLGAENANTTTAATIRYFIDNIDAADVATTMTMQTQLIEALDSVDYKYDCLGDKLHAINIVILDCKTGDDTFENLYNEVAVDKNELNRPDCVSDKLVPYTSINEFKTIVETFAEHEGWYINCLLNSPSLFYQVCSESLKGYTNSAIITNLANYTSGLTMEMVENFVARCPDPEVTPLATENTCYLYCLNEPTSAIATTVVLKESQVETVIESCPICEVDDNDVEDICHDYYCKSTNVTDIVEDVKKPKATVEYVIANNCSLKCIITNAEVKVDICEQSKCREISASTIADDVKYPLDAVNDVISDCDTIVPTCSDIDEDSKNDIELLGCPPTSLPAALIAGIVDYPVAAVQAYIDELGCQP